MVQARVERNHHFDFISGLLITYVLFFHACHWGGYNGLVYNVLLRLLYWFMPWFFYKSGMYYKEQNIENLCLKSFKKLIVPYIIFTFIGLIVEIVCLFIEDEFNMRYLLRQGWYLLIHGYIHANNPLWFLLTLFITQNLFNLLITKRVSASVVLFVNLGFAFVITLLKCFESVRPYFSIPYWCYSSNLACIFYSIGYLLRKRQYGNVITIISVIITLLVLIFDFSYISMNSNTIDIGHQSTWIIGSLFSILLINNVVRFLPKRVCLLLSYPGRNTIVYLLCHVPIYSMIYILNLKILKIDNGFTLSLLYFMSAILLMPILVHFLNKPKISFLIGKG